MLHIMAQDGGNPPLSTNVTVIVTIRDVNDNEPSFDNSFYNASVFEDVSTDYCVLQVAATDPDADEFGRITYSMGHVFGISPPAEFSIRPETGWICATMSLDRDRGTTSFLFPVQATDGGGLHSVTMVNINILDVNDNKPIFYPHIYAVDLSEDSAVGTEVISVAATDRDAGAYGLITYQITSGNENNIFTINSRSGMIRLQLSLNRQLQSLHQLTISATDGGGLQSLIDADVSISVISSEDSPPIFDHPIYSYSVSEDSPRFQSISTVHAAHADPDNRDSITYTIHSGDPDGYFSLHPTTGVLSINSALDYESHVYVLLNIQAASGNPPTHGRAQVNISIIDVNDNFPEFARASEVVSVSETITPGTILPFIPVATDRDSGDNGKVEYRLVDSNNMNNFDGLFSINKLTGQIQIHRTVEYSEMSEYELIIEAYDKGHPSLSSVMTLKVYIQDMNNNGPQFYPTSYEVDVAESLVVGERIVTVSATDGDLGNNARITYTLRASQYAGNFGIFPDTGVLYTKKMLDRELVPDYVLEVIAKDNGDPVQSATATVIIHVTDVNDNNPRLLHESYHFTINENEIAYSYVDTVSASDRDQGTNGEIVYSIQPDDTFSIDEQTGMISTNMMLDREANFMYTLTVTATDLGTPARQDTSVVYINVLDENDNPPEFNHKGDYVANVREDEPPNSAVIQVTAKDPDSGSNGVVSYDLVAGGIFNNQVMFTIDETNGMIRTRAVLDRESKSSYHLTVMARDHGNPPKEAVAFVRVEVKDENDNSPKFMNSTYAFTVQENTPPSTNIGQVIAADRDAGNNGAVRYYIIDGDIYGTFEINHTTGNIFTVKYVDYELAASHVLTILASDMNILHPLSTTTTVHIYITDLNDNAPEFANDPIIFPLRENVAIGHVAYTFSAVDADSGWNGKIRYNISGHSGKHIMFEIHPETGELKTTDYINREEYSEYTLVIEAMDLPLEPQQPLIGTTTARIIIEDENDNSPLFVSRSYTYVMEDEPLGYPIMHINALDPDFGDNGRVVYNIVDGNEEGKFTIEHSTGILSLVDPLDREQRDAYGLNISASDHGVLPRVAFQYLIIYLEDVNDNAPVFTSDMFVMDVQENQDAFIYLGSVNATDADIDVNGQVLYSIPNGIANDMFWINADSGAIYTNGALDRETLGSYAVTVYANDQAFPSLFDTTLVLVNVLDMNDHAPVFAMSTYSISVPENGQTTRLHVVVATDADTGTNAEIRYSITGGNEGNRFVIDPITGEFSTQITLDRETKHHYELEITAEDMATNPLTGTMNITVDVVDLNDNAPLFENLPYTVSIPEDFAVNGTVLTVVATDADLGTNAGVNYTLENLMERVFRIDCKTGDVTSVRRFDRESQAEYFFHVNATDESVSNPLSSQAPIHIIITDINDNAPEFTQEPFTANISNDLPVDSSVLQISSSDSDEGVNAEVTYSLLGTSSYFKVESNGIVKSIATINAQSMHRIDVRVTDNGVPSLSTDGYVLIHVDDATPPIEFQQGLYERHITEHAVYNLVVINMRSEVVNPVGGIRFAIEHGNDAFEIEEDSGIVTVKDPSLLDRETTPHITLTISASVNTDRYGFTHLKIILDDINDNPPIFIHERYSAQVWENELRNTYVTQVIATDADIGDNAVITYSITKSEPDEQDFIIDSGSGVILTRFILDWEIHKTYKLTIKAVDGSGSNALTSSCVVRVKVIDTNDNSPTFAEHNGVKIKEGKYYIFNVAVPELTPTGVSILTVNATDRDSGLNARIIYSIDVNPGIGFTIDPHTGILFTNDTIRVQSNPHVVHLGISATDHGEPALSSLVSVRIEVTDVNDNSPMFIPSVYEASVSEAVTKGHNVTRVHATDADYSRENNQVDYSIISGNIDNMFEISASSGQIAVLGDLDRETLALYTLIVQAADRGEPQQSNVATVNIEVEDFNDHTPEFNEEEYEGTVSEGVPVGTTILTVHATDRDIGLNAMIRYDISSGNELDLFKIDQSTGVITSKSRLDHDTQQSVHRLSIIAMDSGIDHQLQAVTSVIIHVTDENDHAPFSPALMYVKTLAEEEPIGTYVFTAHAVDNDGGRYGVLTYTLEDSPGRNYFEIDAESGEVTSLKKFDYETDQWEYLLSIKASDIGGKYVTVQARIEITGVDEFAPEFSSSDYSFLVPANAEPGYTVGQVSAIDKDAGLDGLVLYYFDKELDMFTINETHGYITVKDSLEVKTQRDVSSVREARATNEADMYQFNVVARSGKPNSLSASTKSDITLDYDCDTCPGALSSSETSLSGLPLALVIVFAIIAAISVIVGLIGFLIWYRRKRRPLPPPLQTTDGTRSVNSYDASFDPVMLTAGSTIEQHLISGPNGVVPVYTMNGTRKPQRMDSPHTSMEVGRTDVSDQSNSASSGRGSATVEDEEIRMINEKPIVPDHHGNNQLICHLPPDSGIPQDEDAMSDDMSVNERSANEVLKSLGVFNESYSKGENFNKILNQSVESMHVFGEEGGGEERGAFINSKLHDSGEDTAIINGTRAFGMGDDGLPSMAGSLSSIVNSDEEFSGSYSWDYLLDWGPQFQPLANVFAEIAKLKDESIAKKQLEEHKPRHKQSLSPKVKNFPPPLLTTVVQGPLTPVQPVAINRSRINQGATLPMMPRSPITYDHSFSSPAMSPNFSPSLSPLANRTPSISPLVTPLSSTVNSNTSTPQRSPRHSTIITLPALAGVDEVTI
uniref:Protein dachsous-like n=1 Tax=Saccoglossus kowalevskii TaxID=10224 RepID=A0ABM0MAC4_SACKO|nr:PREDICTED: protein dachsous-like [Saccoglossus kowalevskii]